MCWAARVGGAGDEVIMVAVRRGGLLAGATLAPRVLAMAGLAGVLAEGGCTIVPDLTPSDHPVLEDGGAGGSTFFGDDAGFGPGISGAGLQPQFGPVTVASRPPPTISGGTLIVTRDGAYAVAADPDRDVVYVVDLANQALAFTVTLGVGDEPGRLAEDGAGRVHVALRGGGALVTIDVATGTILARRSVCPAPRGVAWDQATDSVWVACATGELVSLPSAGGAATSTTVVERDLRDVVVNGTSLAVSQFRSAQVLNLDASGNVTRRDQLPSPIAAFTPQVVWRTVAGPSGTLVTVHQAESTQSIATKVTGGYGSGGCGSPGFPALTGVADAGGNPSFATCTVAGDGGAGPTAVNPSTLVDASAAASSGDASTPLLLDQPLPPSIPPPPPPGFGGGCGSPVVSSVLTVQGADGTALVNLPFSGTLPVDVAVSNDGTAVAAVAPGNAFAAQSELDNLFIFTNCGSSVVSTGVESATSNATAQVTAVAFDHANEVVVQSREPAFLAIVSAGGVVSSTIALSSTHRDDTGHDVFHTQAGALIACASCHPEGRDDGHVWMLDGALRRTPSLRGTIAGTAPYHWPGDEANLDVLVDDVYTVRMGGANLDPPTMGALTGWVQSVPALPAPAWVDAAAASRGQALFVRADVGCATCHSGPKLTNNTTVDVGTGGAFQVPPLVGVGWRAPLMHDGCAATIADRFGACATPQHGSTANLSSQDVSDLIAYLESL
jgi:mono/diheme cytochrome c family protein